MKDAILESFADEVKRRAHQCNPPGIYRTVPDWEHLVILARMGQVVAESDNRGFVARVGDWLKACFTREIIIDPDQRNHRFLEESLELVQCLGCTKDEAHQLVDYVFGRDEGKRHQEIGGVMVTLAALCWAHGIGNLNGLAEIELARVWGKIEQIRKKAGGEARRLAAAGQITMSIIDDWLRQHPNLMLTRDQRSDLEELIREDYAPPDDPFDMNADLREDDDIAKRVIFTRGAKAMQASIALEFSVLDGVGSGVGNVIAGLAGFIEKIAIPQMPEEDENATT